MQEAVSYLRAVLRHSSTYDFLHVGTITSSLYSCIVCCEFFVVLIRLVKTSCIVDILVSDNNNHGIVGLNGIDKEGFRVKGQAFHALHAPGVSKAYFNKARDTRVVSTAFGLSKKSLATVRLKLLEAIPVAGPASMSFSVSHKLEAKASCIRISR